MIHGRALLALVLAAACAPTAGSLQPKEPAPMPMTHHLVPVPVSFELAQGGPFVVTADTRIVVDPGHDEAARTGEYLAAILRPSTGHPLPVSFDANPAAHSIALRIVPDEALGEEGYRLTVSADSVRLAANRPAGLFRGVQTLRQLLPATIEAEQSVTYKQPWSIPAATIVDHPRFAWRGAMLDVARHFFSVDEVKEYVDALALYKINVLHLHLSDDQGWRIAIGSRPLLAEIGGSTQVGGGPGGFYSKEDYAEIVRHAGERYITVVPEIDMPGHTNAALAAYPELSCGKRPPAIYTGIEVGFSALCVDKEETYALIDDIVRELAAMTPGPYLHVGGDEVEALTADEYARFIERVQEIVAGHGKRMIGWEEIAKARLHPTSLVQQWRSDSAGAAVRHGARVVLSPAKRIYLDMKYTPRTELGLNWAGHVEVRDAYDWNPAAFIAGVGEEQIAGLEAPLWTETVTN
ncbi:MAG: beta-N-acetylhexosaminidase, partial [Gemmatimonadetes bacterium]|nr:beta-N-acetylhexosaminidase [Gemmatimonadota bacterium]